MKGTPNPESVSTRLERIAKLARQMPGTALRTLSHHIDIEWLKEAYRRTRKDGAAGVDEQSAKEYAANLEGNLQTLLDRAKSGDRYRAPPVRRVHIPKGDGRKTRPIGIPTFEDKVLQRSVAMVLEAVHEQDFLDCSYGFRPGRSAHDALRTLRAGMMEMAGGWVLEADIEAFFDSVNRNQLQQVLRQRVQDGVLLRLVGKWLNAGVMEEGQLHYPDAGTPQGGVISPLLANIFLHEVLDLWFEREVKPRLRGQAFLVRYADDFVIVFSAEEDARRVLDVLPKRFGKYNLRLHPEKTRLIQFRRPPLLRELPKEKEPGSFGFLGFHLYWARSRQGKWIVLCKTASSRLARALVRVNDWCRAHRHDPIREQHKTLTSKLRGHYNYFAVTGNHRAVNALRFLVTRVWFKWLCRRSRANPDWVWMNRLLRIFPLPRATIRPIL
jgi:group II intron reverse transcriptase/maturase